LDNKLIDILKEIESKKIVPSKTYGHYATNTLEFYFKEENVDMSSIEDKDLFYEIRYLVQSGKDNVSMPIPRNEVPTYFERCFKNLSSKAQKDFERKVTDDTIFYVTVLQSTSLSDHKTPMMMLQIQFWN
jgi:hypothetical protein